MPRGASSFIKSNERSKARSAAAGTGQALQYFAIEDGQRARVRFLEHGEELTWAVVHRLRRGKYFSDVPCLDQEDEGIPCPACSSMEEEISKRSKKGFLNLIWRGNEDLQELNEKITPMGEKAFVLGPIYKKSDKGYTERDANKKPIITGFGDSVFLWKCSATNFNLAVQTDRNYKGLMSRDFVISREGSGLSDTKYTIVPAEVDGGPQPMLVADMSIMQEKFDLDSLTKSPTFEEMRAIVNGQGTVAENSSSEITPAQNDVFGGSAPLMRSSAFNR
jgi:hypothetical protein